MRGDKYMTVLFRYLVMFLASLIYAILDKKKRSYWERLTVFYGILLFVIPIEYLRIINSNYIIELKSISYYKYDATMNTLYSFVLITLSLCLFIVSLLMYRSEKDKNQ